MAASSDTLLTIENFIRGGFVSNTEAGLSYIDSYEPATGKVWARITDSGEDEVQRAVLAAKNAFPKLVTVDILLLGTH